MPRYTPEERDQLIDIFEDAAMQFDARVEDYSGRGMYGARCFAFFPEEDRADIFQLGVIVGDYASEAGFPIHRIPRACVDSMGRGVVIYFPDLNWPEDLARPSEQDEEEEA